MARKNRPILYEVAKRGKNPPLRGASRSPVEEPPRQKTKPAPRPEPQQPTPPPAAVEPPPPEPTPSSERPSPLAGGPIKSGPEQTSSLLGGFEPSTRLQFWVIAGAAAVIVLFIAFALGQRFSTPAPAENKAVPVAEELPPATDGRQPAAPPNAPFAEQRAPADELVIEAGYHYVVVQHFALSKEDAANAAAAYLIENGIACAILPGADLRLIAAEAFLINQTSTAAAAREQRKADRLIQRIRELGKDYLLKGGYDFSGAAAKQLAAK